MESSCVVVGGGGGGGSLLLVDGGGGGGGGASQRLLARRVDHHDGDMGIMVIAVISLSVRIGDDAADPMVERCGAVLWETEGTRAVCRMWRTDDGRTKLLKTATTLVTRNRQSRGTSRSIHHDDTSP
jgi:hypothetical protein